MLLNVISFAIKRSKIDAPATYAWETKRILSYDLRGSSEDYKSLRGSKADEVTSRHVYVTANLRNQIFLGIPDPFGESGESVK